MDVTKNFEVFISYIGNFIKRDGVSKFIEWLVEETDISTAPASTKYHMSREGGLVKHSINVMKRLIRLVQMEYGSIENSPFSKETLAFVSLFHDISKVNFYEKYVRNVKNQENGQWEQIESYRVKEPKDRFVYGSPEENSVYILSKFFDMSIEESSAIRWVEGYSNSNDPSTVASVFSLYGMSNLAVLLHTANLLAICIDESDNVKMNDIVIKEEENEQDSLRPTPDTLDCPF